MSANRPSHLHPISAQDARAAPVVDAALQSDFNAIGHDEVTC